MSVTYHLTMPIYFAYFLSPYTSIFLENKTKKDKNLILFFKINLRAGTISFIELRNRTKFATTVFSFNDDLQYLMLTFPPNELLLDKTVLTWDCRSSVMLLTLPFLLKSVEFSDPS